jgi:hypothetical protein
VEHDERNTAGEQAVREQPRDAADEMAHDDAAQPRPVASSLKPEDERRGAETRKDERLSARPRERPENDEQHAGVQARPDPMPSHCSR